MWVVRVRWLTEEYSQTRRRSLLSRRGYGAKRGAGCRASGDRAAYTPADNRYRADACPRRTARPEPRAKPGLAPCLAE
jgi:hypothetical protein